MQLLPNGLGGAFMSLDFLHHRVQHNFNERVRLPAWLPTALGLYKLTQTALNWIAGGAYVPFAQLMFSFQLGEAAYANQVCIGPGLTHGGFPRKGKEGVGLPKMALATPAIHFIGSSALLYLTAAPLLIPFRSLFLHLLVAAMGFASSFFVMHISPERSSIFAIVVTGIAPSAAWAKIAPAVAA